MSEDIINQEQEEDYGNGLMDLSTGTPVEIATGFVGLPLLAGAAEALNLGWTGVAIGAVGAVTIGLVGKHVIDKERANGHNINIPIIEQFRNANWSALLGQIDEEGNIVAPQQETTAPASSPEPEIHQVDPDPEQTNESTEEANPFEASTAQTEATPPRITIDSIVSHTQRNNYEVYIGRSLTRPRNPAVKINFYKRHLKLIGASQHGKSSMAAALLDAIIRTHDPDRVQIALLDLENKTSRLFASAPHIVKMDVAGFPVRLHARNEDEVLRYLEYLLALVDYRYNNLSEEELEQQPLIIVYLEEFIDLKDYFKQRIDAVVPDEKERAKRDYARLVFCIKKLARRGLKVLVQFLMCAQVDYRDEDLQEALINVTSGMSFSVRVSAAQAAGFYQTQLLQRNAREDQVGQAVVEMPDCKDLILAPDYDLRARLKALNKQIQAQREREAPPVPVTSVVQEPLSRPSLPPAATRRLYALPKTRPFMEDLQPRKPEPELTEREQLYEKALKAWEGGAQSIRTMKEALDLNFNQARELLDEMEKLGLITRKSNAV
ncbi:FtsK/SpoIIIE domain-containing protein [Ktedonobacter racemifer]|uniref:FtsK domain-containing protein n=1 Tax=Ktedonobacter racemifer DSM 44963 TaxID=485913 RepID=D6TLC8_KTERA|nr:FtsK/SpoIIIE domain-containing protein [Ktedonobacter racemifer]EFH86578.1 hypothetical protein Krac_7881 [Ktedonobacter racemifer DSM 44963]